MTFNYDIFQSIQFGMIDEDLQIIESSLIETDKEWPIVAEENKHLQCNLEL